MNRHFLLITDNPEVQCMRYAPRPLLGRGARAKTNAPSLASLSLRLIGEGETTRAQERALGLQSEGTEKRSKASPTRSRYVLVSL